MAYGTSELTNRCIQGSGILISPKKSKRKATPKTNSAQQSVGSRSGSPQQQRGTKWPTTMVDFTHRPCASWREPWCKTSSHRSRRRTSSRRSHGRSCCARVATTAFWRPCHMLHTLTKKRKSHYCRYIGYDILRRSLYGTVSTNTIQVCEVTQILERALYQKKAIRVSGLKQQVIFKTTAGFQLLTAAWVMVEVLRYIRMYYYWPTVELSYWPWSVLIYLHDCNCEFSN